jgi:hypothetical protein
MSRKGAWFVFALLCACQRTHPSLLPVDTPPDLATPILPVAIKIVADNPRLLDGAATQTSFRLPFLRELYVRLQVPSLPSDISWATLRVFTPTGDSYHERKVPFTADTNPRQATPPGAALPIDVIPAKPLAGGFGLDQEIVVGGTNFVRYPRPGFWKISFTLEGTTMSAEQMIELGGM